MAFSEAVVALVKAIPRGRVATYGQLAALAGNPGAARQVARLLHTLSEKEGLPWHRVLNREGRISLPRGRGYEEQRARLVAEGVRFGPGDRLDLARYGWRG
jgi:methylated-DNA-protein-cysteine methyltransferase-like protein